MNATPHPSHPAARAMLMKPDILLLDEPTNHLDVVNVAWLEDYLVRVIPRVTCCIVSHDSGFLDNVRPRAGRAGGFLGACKDWYREV